MKFKHKRQHSQKPQPEFTESYDRFGNLTITASWNGQTAAISHASELRIPQIKKELSRQLRA